VSEDSTEDADAQAELRDALLAATHQDPASISWSDSILRAAIAASDLAPSSETEITPVLVLLRELATGVSPEVPDNHRAIAWWYFGELSLHLSDQTPHDHEVAAECYGRALRLISRETSPEIWARLHDAVGTAYCEQLLAGLRTTSWEGYRSLLLAARSELTIALEVLTKEEFPEDYREIRSRINWTISSLDKLNKRRAP